MSLHLIIAKIIHSMCSFLFGVIFFGAAAVGILTGLVVSVCEDVCRCFGPGVLNRLVNLCCVPLSRMVMQRDTRFILVQAIEALRPV